MERAGFTVSAATGPEGQLPLTMMHGMLTRPFVVPGGHNVSVGKIVPMHEHDLYEERLVDEDGGFPFILKSCKSCTQWLGDYIPNLSDN